MPVRKRDAFADHENYILYKDTTDLIVTGKYKTCVHNKEALCECAFYVRVNDVEPSYAFVDHCVKSPYLNHELSYFDKDTEDFPLLNCNYLILNEMSEVEWESVPLSRGYFQCARLISSLSAETYVLKTTYDATNKSVKIKFTVKSDPTAKYGLTRIEVNPPAGLKHKTAGICGNTALSSDQDCSLHWESPEDSTQTTCSNSSTDLGLNWK